MRSALLLLPPLALAYPFFHTGGFLQPDNRTIDEIYQAALKEKTVTLWHGGDEAHQQDALKFAFEKRFPGVTLNLTVDVSKYLDVNIDEQLVNDGLYVDVTMLQTLQDYPRWKEFGALLAYKPIEFDKLYNQITDDEGYYYGVRWLYWPISGTVTAEDYPDMLDEKFKDKLVLTYPNDDDAVLHNFNELIKQYGTSWFESLLKQNIQWVRGSQTPQDVILRDNSTKTTTFAAFGSYGPGRLQSVIPKGHFTSWAQTGAIFKDAPHPEAAKLLMNFVISEEWQGGLAEYANGWSIRKGGETPLDLQNTDPLGFRDFMMDREAVERLRFWLEQKIGPPQGLDSVVDDL